MSIRSAPTSQTMPQRCLPLRWVILLLWVCCAPWALAESAPEAAGKVVLTVNTKADAGHGGQTQRFDLAMLQALAQHSFETRTPWDARPVRFEGPLLRDVLARAHARGQEVMAVAQNDYTVTIPWSDIERYPVVLALKMNGLPIPARTKGPLFLIYPFSQFPDMDAIKARERSIWQLQRLDVR